MRIFYAFLIIVTAAMLWMLPITDSIYDFRTDLQEDTFASDTAVGVTTANVTLSKVLYDSDNQTIDILSSLSDDAPAFSSYNVTSRLLGISGLSANTTRVLTVTYDVDALSASNAISNFLDVVPWMWLMCLAVFAPAALVSMFVGRRA